MASGMGSALGSMMAQPSVPPPADSAMNRAPGPDPQAFQAQILQTADERIRSISSLVGQLISSYPMAEESFNAALMALAKGRQDIVQAMSLGPQAGPTPPPMQTG